MESPFSAGLGPKRRFYVVKHHCETWEVRDVCPLAVRVFKH